jgi:hypothetical protein
MGILDEAIREHLALKRQHGADDSELKQLEDDAFGPPQRPGAGESTPDAASEAATEFMPQPDLGDGDGQSEQAEKPPEPSSTRREPVADVQEPPEHAAEQDPADEQDDEPAEEEHGEPAEEQDDAPAVEEQPAEEHEAVPPAQPSHTTEERHAIADQPTEMYDVEGDFAPAEASDPSDEELVAEEITEPRLAPAPAEPIEDLEDEVEEAAEAEVGEDDDFFDEQRLSDELDQALEAPLDPESEEVEQPASEEEQPATEPESDEFEPEADSEEADRPAGRPADEDVLEETPDFLEEAPEDDQLWFEQKPPKDFDFDD